MRLSLSCFVLPAALLAAPALARTPCCQNLGEVRTNIDRIDDQILRLMAERSRYVAQAGRFKTSAATVRDEARIRQILTRIRAKATTTGVDPDVAEATFRAMVEGFTAEEARQVGH
ncbi:chorismate mutase [Sphingomonas fuzhouensis]|uniref:chorismate mutase n=1 Tax=Sphingomonas fuzhouensis TaxID=3106033 RepID=UPI002B0013D8|nr:chorismate mutase [Sphingomonas sp. SGZ-02]